MDRSWSQKPPKLPDHAGLALTKFNQHVLPRRFKSEDNKEFFGHAAKMKPPTGYHEAYDRWRSRLRSHPMAGAMQRFTVQGRMVVGIGAANVLQNSVTMNRVWGMPIIPGSALKGLASHYAASLPNAELDETHREALFGTTEDAGYFTWLDAWYVPDPTRSPFALDVVTPHHGRYYQDPASNPPWDFDDPIPSNFISVRGDFLVAVLGPGEAWVEAALTILTRALAEWGIGAKTNAEYGVLTPTGERVLWGTAAEIESRERADDETREKERRQAIDGLIAELADSSRPIEQQATRWVAIWATIADDQQRTEVGTAILRRLQSRGREYHRVTGRLAPGYTGRTPGEPRTFMKDLLTWMDEHAPEVSLP